MRIIGKHRCKQNPDCGIILWEGDKQWCMEIGYGYIYVTYCPHCGIKL